MSADQTASQRTSSSGSNRVDSPGPTGDSAAFHDAPGLSLSRFLDVAGLTQLQQRFARMTGLRISIRDPDGQILTTADDNPTDQPPVTTDLQAQPTVAIEVEGRRLGSISIEAGMQVSGVAATANIEAAAEFLDLWANGIALLCHQGFELSRRVEEFSALYKLSTLLSAKRDLQELLDTATRSAAEVMKVKAASIRLLDDEGRELIPRAVFNLSPQYLSKGPVAVAKSELYKSTLEKAVVYVEDMATDPRVLYPEDARREGLVSILAAAMVYQDRPIGVIRLYTGQRRSFSRHEVEMLRAVAQLLATAIENARLHAEQIESERVQQQVHMAAAVQRRMLPASAPQLPPFDIAARYVPSFELGGDFYDFIALNGHLGIAIGDVVGKGVAASLLMASVRASLRAYAQDIYDLNEIIARVNIALSRETLDNEFATLFYAVVDPVACQMTYCNAGHDPPLLLRDGDIQQLEAGGMIIGVDETQQYDKGLLDMKPGDLLVLNTDGLSDALSFKGERFGRERIIKAMRDVADAPARDAMNHILWEMRRFVGLKRNVDDTTLVVVKVKQQ